MAEGGLLAGGVATAEGRHMFPLSCEPAEHFSTHSSRGRRKTTNASSLIEMQQQKGDTCFLSAVNPLSN